MNTENLLDHSAAPPPAASPRDFAIFIAKWASIFALSFALLNIPIAYCYEQDIKIADLINVSTLLIAAFIFGFSYLVLRQAISTLEFDFQEKWWALWGLLFAVILFGESLFNFVFDARIVTAVFPAAISTLLPLRTPFDLLYTLKMAAMLTVMAVGMFRNIKRTRG
jgi:hypothetical protein